jgi:hypothetical protein
MRFNKIALVFVFSIFLLLNNQCEGRGKTYDDLEEIIKVDGEGKLASRQNHVKYQETLDQGSRIDPNKVVHKPVI